MIPEDIDWTRLLGAYRIPYDPRNAIRRLELDDDTSAAWEELWNELYHQGDVGEASYAAVPYLVRICESTEIADWNSYALIATIEEARHKGHNPELPENLRRAYDASWLRLIEIGLRDLKAAKEPVLVASIIGALAMGKDLPNLGYFAISFAEDERAKILENYR